MTRPRLPRTPRRLDPIPGHRAQDEQTMAMLLALASELVVVRARLDSCERLLADAGVLAPGAIDAYTPDDAAAAQREAIRARAIAKILRPLHELAERDHQAAIDGKEACE